MKYELIGAIVLSAAAFTAAAAAEQQADRPLSRSLTVEQTAIYNVRPTTTTTTTTTGDEGLEVLAWVDRPNYTYASGENVRVFVETNKDAYVTVLNVDPAGEATVLFPNQYQSDNFLAAGRALQVPDPSAGFRFVVTGNVGVELLKVVASTRPIPLFEASQLAEAGPFQVVRAQPARLARSLTVVMTDTNRASPSGGDAPQPAGAIPTAAGVSLATNSTEWAMCHQAITTVPTLSAAARRTRSLTVQRTQESGALISCEEGR